MPASEPQQGYAVYVDATISNRQDPALPKETFVAYVVEGSQLRGVRKVEASETDDAEIQAILFTIDELKGRLDRFVAFCDHESVVSEVNRESEETPPLNQLLQEVRSRLRSNPSIRIELFKTNPADRYLKQLLRRRNT